jgi:hypothetical protein
MIAADSDTPRNSMRTRSWLRRMLLTAVAILGVWLAFVTMGPVVVNRLSRVQDEPALATAEERSFPAVATASGVLLSGKRTALVLRAAFSQTEAVQLAAGQSATVIVAAIPGLTLPAKVSSVDTSATQVGGVPEYFAEIQLGTSDPRLSIGETGSVNVEVANANNVLSIPSVALFTGANDQTQVDVWSNGRAYATTVDVGMVGTVLTQTTSGPQAGEQVMLSPAGVTELPAASPSPTV